MKLGGHLKQRQRDEHIYSVAGYHFTLGIGENSESTQLEERTL